VFPLNTWTYSELKSEPVAWLWGPYLARGKLAVLDGDPGAGKTFLALDLAARLSRGGPLPDGKTLARPHTTLLLIADDVPADTTRPRLEAAGADLDRVIAAYPTAPGFRLPDHVHALEDAVRRHRADLVVIDPLAGIVPDAATGDYLAARKALVPLVVAADTLGCAILLVRHLTKAGTPRSIYRGVGSIGVAGTVGTGLLVARHPDDPELRVLTQTKNKVGPPAPSLGFRLRPDDRGRAAVEWLQASLANGTRKASELIASAATAGIPLRTLERAKKDLGVKCRQVRKDETSEWVWSDRPADPDPDDPVTEVRT
jgi:hypothetical protein